MEGGSTATLLGTDFQGRDILSRLIYGARVSLIVGLMGTLVAGGIGTAMGILSGYVGGWVDQVIMRVTDAWLALARPRLRDLPGHHGRAQHVEHHHHPGRRVLDALRARHPRRGADACASGSS